VELSRVQVPLVFGVTGHRDLQAEDIPGLEKKVREVLLEFRGRYPSSPFVLLSPLAEGADRLVARIAMSAGIGARLVAPLPMPQALYETDFASPDSLAEFRELLAKASHTFEIPCSADVFTVRRPGPARDRQYEEVGKYIARESQILIALWDGKQSSKVGGTAAIVKFQTEGVMEREDRDLTPPELFPVYHILTPRVSNPNVIGEPLQLNVIYPPAFANLKDAENYYSRTFSNLEEFNREAGGGSAALPAEVVVSRGRVTGDFDLANLSPGEALTLQRYSIADALAIRYQKSVMQTHWALHWLVFFSFLCFVLFAHLPAHSGPVLALSLLLLGVAYLSHQRGKKMRLDMKSQDYRAMAEACRVWFFWQIAGIPDSVADNYLGKQRTELDWIRYALRGWRIEADSGPSTWSNPADRLKFILDHWVKDQRKYFDKASEKSEKQSEGMERWVVTFLSLAIGFAIALAGAVVYVQYSEGEWWRCPDCEWTDWPVILIDAFLAAGALLHHASQRRAHAEHRKQYTRMINIFENASRAIEQKADLQAARVCLRKLGQEALLENGDWVLLHRERPLELPHP
jgi:uncharacterized membrane protein